MSDEGARLFCKDCVFCVPDKVRKYKWAFILDVAYEFNDYSKCSYPSTLNIVTGEPQDRCAYQRQDFRGQCGPDAKWFVPRATESTLGG